MLIRMCFSIDFLPTLSMVQCAVSNPRTLVLLYVILQLVNRRRVGHALGLILRVADPLVFKGPCFRLFVWVRRRGAALDDRVSRFNTSTFAYDARVRETSMTQQDSKFPIAWNRAFK